jgi:hypothetical protein
MWLIACATVRETDFTYLKIWRHMWMLSLIWILNHVEWMNFWGVLLHSIGSKYLLLKWLCTCFFSVRVHPYQGYKRRLFSETQPQYLLCSSISLVVNNHFKLGKGQLNSEWIYVVIVSPKIPTKNYRDFCPTL